jgi:hypothetical protein
LEITTGEYGLSQDASWVLNQEPELLIETLWRIGFLRAQAVGGIKALRRSGSSYVGPHQLANLNLRNIPRFQVHPMFRAYLGMKEARDAAVGEYTFGAQGATFGTFTSGADCTKLLFSKLT